MQNFKKRLFLIIIRACKRGENLRVSKKNINFAPDFAPLYFELMLKYLKIVHSCKTDIAKTGATN